MKKIPAPGDIMIFVGDDRDDIRRMAIYKMTNFLFSHKSLTEGDIITVLGVNIISLVEEDDYFRRITVFYDGEMYNILDYTRENFNKKFQIIST